MNWEGFQEVYGWLELMVHCIPPKAEDKSVPVFIHPPMAHPGVMCGQHGCNPPYGWLSNVRPTSHIHPLMNWYGCQYVHGWLELMIHDKSPKAIAGSVPIFIHPPITHHWSVMLPICMLILVWLLMQWQNNLAYTLIDELGGMSRCV